MSWRNRILADWYLLVGGGLLMVVTGTGTLYASEVIDETACGVVLAVAPLLVLCAFILRYSLASSGARSVVGATVALTFLVTAIPAVCVIIPGERLFRGELAGAESTLAVPPGVNGPIRLFVNYKMRSAAVSSITVEFLGVAEPVRGSLGRAREHTRLGGKADFTTREQTAVYLPAVIPNGATELSVVLVRGVLDGTLEITAYRACLQPRLSVLLSLLMLAIAAVVDGAWSLGKGLVIPCAMALAFSLTVQASVAPGSAVRAICVGLLPGAIVGAIAGIVAGTAVHSLLSRRRKRKRR